MFYDCKNKYKSRLCEMFLQVCFLFSVCFRIVLLRYFVHGGIVIPFFALRKSFRFFFLPL